MTRRSSSRTPTLPRFGRRAAVAIAFAVADDAAGVEPDQVVEPDVGSIDDGTDGGEDAAALPEGWPIDVLPHPIGFEVLSASGGPTGTMTVAFTSGPDADTTAVLSDYAARLEEDGFAVTTHTDDHVYAERPGDQRGEDRRVDIVVVPADDATVIEVEYRHHE